MCHAILMQFLVCLRSCGTLQQALDLIEKQCPRNERPREADSISEATTLQSLS